MALVSGLLRLLSPECLVISYSSDVTRLLSPGDLRQDLYNVTLVGPIKKDPSTRIGLKGLK